MKRTAKPKGLFDRIRGEAEHLEDVVKRLAKQAPGFLARAHEQIRKIGNEHVRPELARGIRVIAKALDDVSGSLAPEEKPRGRRRKTASRRRGRTTTATTRKKKTARKSGTSGATTRTGAAGKRRPAASAGKAPGRKQARRRRRAAR
jgi:hypothetical protein